MIKNFVFFKLEIFMFTFTKSLISANEKKNYLRLIKKLETLFYWVESPNYWVE